MATKWEKKVEQQIAAVEATKQFPELCEAIIIWRQEIAECHALLERTVFKVE
jgi:hypothetical protein